MLAKVILWISALAFCAYGIACLFSPGLPASYSGLAITNGDAFVELGAMYGGLQTAFGIFCLLGALRRDLLQPALTALLLLMGGLALSRTGLTAISADPVTGYTYGALAFEWATALLAAVALTRTPG